MSTQVCGCGLQAKLLQCTTSEAISRETSRFRGPRRTCGGARLRHRSTQPREAKAHIDINETQTQGEEIVAVVEIHVDGADDEYVIGTMRLVPADDGAEIKIRTLEGRYVFVLL